MVIDITVIAPVVLPPTKGDALNIINFIKIATQGGITTQLLCLRCNGASKLALNVKAFPIKLTLPKILTLFLFSIWALLETRKSEVVIVRHWLVSLPFIFLFSLINKKVIYDVSSISYLENKKHRKLMKYIEKFNCYACWRIKTLSNGLKNFINKELKISREKIFVIPPLVFTSAPKLINKKKDIILYAGTLDPWQGVDTLVKAYASLQIPEKLILLSHSKLSSELQDYISKKKVANRIKVFGVPNSEMQYYYQRAKMMVIPRPSTDLTEIVPPIKLFESLASGSPVIASNVGGLNEFVNGGVYLVMPNNPAELAYAIKQLRKPAEYRRRSKQGLNFVRREIDRAQMKIHNMVKVKL